MPTKFRTRKFWYLLYLKGTCMSPLVVRKQHLQNQFNNLKFLFYILEKKVTTRIV